MIIKNNRFLALGNANWLRPLKRLIQQSILDQIAKEIVAGKVKEGDIVCVNADDDEIQIKIQSKQKLNE